MHGSAAVVGVGESSYWVRGESPDTEFQLACCAIGRAVEDAGLRLEDTPAPYFATVRWVRAELLSIEGSYGGVITSLAQQQTAGLANVRVGSPAYRRSQEAGH